MKQLLRTFSLSLVLLSCQKSEVPVLGYRWTHSVIRNASTLVSDSIQPIDSFGINDAHIIVGIDYKGEPPSAFGRNFYFYLNDHFVQILRAKDEDITQYPTPTGFSPLGYDSIHFVDRLNDIELWVIDRGLGLREIRGFPIRSSDFPNSTVINYFKIESD